MENHILGDGQRHVTPGGYTRDSIQRDLQDPPKDARGYTRWWWFGGAVTEEEISRELDLMLEAGIGGVELQILYP